MTTEIRCSVPPNRDSCGKDRTFNAKQRLLIEPKHLYINCHFFMASCLPFVPTLLKGAVRSGRGKNETNAFSLSISQRGSPVEMPGMPCCFLHQQMADGCIPCVSFPFSKLQVTSGLASAWSEQMGVHILYRWLA